MVQALERLAAGTLRPQRQADEGVTYAHKIDKAEAPIDWAQPAVSIERRVRAFDPFPGASFTWQGEVVKVWGAALLPSAGSAEAGQVVDVTPGRVIVACGEGALELIELQRPGGRRIPATQYLASGPGATLRPGASLAARG